MVAIQEERLTRVKRTRIFAGRPSLATSYCLSHAGIGVDELDCVVICSCPGRSEPDHDPLHNLQFEPLHRQGRLLSLSHHLGHAHSAIASAGYERAAVLVIDGVGSPLVDLDPSERRTIVEGGPWAGDGPCYEAISLYEATGLGAPALRVTPLAKQVSRAWLERGHEQLGRMPRFESLGGLYSAVAQQIFGNPRHAGKVMGLASYGRPTIPTSAFLKVDADGQVHYRDEVCTLFRTEERWPARHEQYADLAASAQAALEHAVLAVVGELRRRCPHPHLCYAGGVALNGLLNERIIRESGFEEVFITPAAEDSGTAIGAAYYGLQWWLDRQPAPVRVARPRLRRDATGTEYPPLGPTASSRDDVVEEVVDRLLDGQILGWFQGGSELGPRALGQRSILCDPRRAEAKERLNAAIKRREWFRPFAASVLEEHAAQWFDWGETTEDSPFMLRICPVAPSCRELVPAVVHVDGTARIQTVSRQVLPRFHALIERFFARTNVPLLLNTSFNVRGEPLVETPDDALLCLLTSGLDACVLHDRVIERPPGVTTPLELGYAVSERVRDVQVRPRDDGDVLEVLDGSMPLSICIETPWGTLVREFPEPWAAILWGVREGHHGEALRAEVARAWRRAVSPEELGTALVELGRAGVLRVHVG